MRINTLIILLAFQPLVLPAQVQLAAGPAPTATEVLRTMHAKYFQAPCKFYTFSQKNSHFRNDSLVRNSVWHEAVGFPDKFRISFGEAKDGNYVVFSNDSVFNYKSFKKVKSGRDSSSLLLLLGGMFYRDFEDVLFRIKKAGYNVNKLSEASLGRTGALVIGAEKGELDVNQLWIDRENFRVIRIIEKTSKGMMDMRFEEFQPWCRGFVETKVSFRRDGRLEQVEEYYDIREAEKFPDQ